jgi:alkylated DNA nucleotide flippase Atl1
VGKSHLAISLAIAAAQSGRRVYYGTLANLITSLEGAQQAGWLSHRSRPSYSHRVLGEAGIVRLPRNTGRVRHFRPPFP